MTKDRFPDYDVLAKRDTPSWDEKSRAVVDARLAQAEADPGLGEERLAMLRRLADIVAPQPGGRAPVNTAALVLQAIKADNDGYRLASLPKKLEAWRDILDTLGSAGFAAAQGEAARQIVARMAKGELDGPGNSREENADYWNWVVIPDIVAAYWAHPSAWSAMGFGGPAAPRGYVRMDANMRDPWEAKERDGG